MLSRLLFAAQMVDELEKLPKKLADIGTIGIVATSLRMHRRMYARVQYIVTAVRLLTYRCIAAHSEDRSILPFGIPGTRELKLSARTRRHSSAFGPNMKSHPADERSMRPRRPCEEHRSLS